MSQAVTTSPERQVTEELVADLVSLGGYVHPLFGPTGARPLMGQGLLLLAGGLAEQTGALDHAIALLGLEDVRFHKMVLPDTRISLRQELISERPTSSGSNLESYAWRVHDDSGDLVLEATAVMLTDRREGIPCP